MGRFRDKTWGDNKGYSKEGKDVARDHSEISKLEELTKIFANPFHFLTYVKIQEPGELSLDYVLWPHLIEFFQALDKHKLILLIKSKQIGISWAIATFVLKKLMTVPGSNILELSSGEKEAQKLLSKSKIIFRNLPEWIQNEPDYTIYPDSTEQFGFKGLQSLVTALPSTEKAGIGQTSDLVIHDEADFHDYFEVNLGHTLATIADKPNRQAIIVSTVDKTKPDSYLKQLYRSAMNGANSFYPMFFGYDVRPDRDFSFLEEQRKVNESTPWVVEANYPQNIEEALSPLAAQSCFDKGQLTKLWESALIPEVRRGYIYILHPPRVGVQYAAGIDVGEGVGLDYSCLTIIGKDGLGAEVAAAIYTNKVGTAEFAYDANELCKEYYNPLLNADNIGIGRAVIDKLHELGYTRLFYGSEKKAGWSLTRPNKRELAVKLVESINDGSLITRFKPQIKELMEYQWLNGYPEPTGKTHGDTVIALMLANEMLKKVGPRKESHMYVRGRQIW